LAGRREAKNSTLTADHDRRADYGGHGDRYPGPPLCRQLSKHFGQQVVVANPRARGMIGAQAVANAPADGYTVLFANSGMRSSAP